MLAYAKKMSWIKECLANRWNQFSEEQLAEEILKDEPRNPELHKRTLKMVSAWQNNESNVRAKFQIFNEQDGSELLETFIETHLKAS